jgi:hypothetical protein
VVLSPVISTPSCTIQMQPIYERTGQVQLSGPVCREPDIGVA